MAEYEADLEGMAFTREDLDVFIRQAVKRYAQGDNPLWTRIENRRKHFSLLSPPILPEEYARKTPEQWRGIKDSYIEVVSRLNENPWVARIEAIPDTAPGRKIADDAKALVNDGVRLFERRAGVNLQRGLTNDMFIACYGVLKTTLATEMYPALPEAELYDELPEGADKADYKERYKYKTDKEGKRKRVPYWQDTVTSLRKRQRSEKARAGWPWYHEIVDPGTVALGEDKGIAEGPAWAVEIREVGLIDYSQQLKKADKLCVSLGQDNAKLRIYEEGNAPDDWMPSRGGWENMVAVCEVWTRDEFYELVSDGPVISGMEPMSIGWMVVKATKHPYGRVPYFKSVAIDIGGGDPALRWLPIADRMFDAKPGLDRTLELADVLAERVSLNEVYFVHEQTGALLRREDESGDPVTMSMESAAAWEIPEGYKPMSVERRVDPAFTRQVDQKLEAAEKSKPSSGRAEGTTGTTAPTTVLQLQLQENIEPSMYLDNIAACFRECFGMMLRMMSDEAIFPDGVWVFASGKYADKDKGTLVGIAKGESGSLDVDVDISPTTAAQKLTKIEHVRGLLNDPKWPITPIQALEETGEEDSQGQMAKFYGWKGFEEVFLPAFVKQIMVVLGFDKMVMPGVNGQPIGPGGQPVPPDRVLAAQGALGPGDPGGPVGSAQTPAGYIARTPVLQQIKSQLPPVPNIYPAQGV